MYYVKKNIFYLTDNVLQIVRINFIKIMKKENVQIVYIIVINVRMNFHAKNVKVDMKFLNKNASKCKI